MSKEHHLIVVPGLGGVNSGFNKIVNSWEGLGFVTHIHDPNWKDTETIFQPKLERLVGVIDDLDTTDNIISLVGTSAGGSAVMNAFFDRKNKIHKVVNICGRLRSGENVYPSLDSASKNSPAFRESVTLFESREPALTEEERTKILTIRSLFDEIVPLSTITVDGANNIQIFSVEHLLSITAAMTIYIHPMIKFLQQQ